MIDSQQRLNQLLPEIYRTQDALIAQQSNTENGPLESLLAIVGEQLALIEENLEQSYDDLFIETCAPWVAPYIGDLIGYQSLHGNVPNIASPRAEVAHTIALRRRKGTASVLEQLARDVTGWDAKIVECFNQLVCSQHTNHPRTHCLFSPTLRSRPAIANISTPFNTAAHSVDTRRISSARGRFNIQNIAVFLWRLTHFKHTTVPATQHAPRCYFISPLGCDCPLFSNAEYNAFQQVLSELPQRQVSQGLTRLHLSRYREHYLAHSTTSTPSIELQVNGIFVDHSDISICNLSDQGSDWAHSQHQEKYALDPELGRIVLPHNAPEPESINVTYHRGFSSNIGGGEYERQATFSATTDLPVLTVPSPTHPTIQQALDSLTGSAVVEIRDNAHYEETLQVFVPAGCHIELRAANGFFPHLKLSESIRIEGAENAHFTLNGFLLSQSGIVLPQVGSGSLSSVTIKHCTLVPGLARETNGDPTAPSAASLSIEAANIQCRIEHSICGAIRTVSSSEIALYDSIIDATERTYTAICAPDNGPAGPLSAIACTIIGKIYVEQIANVSNSILLASLAPEDTSPAAIQVVRKQTGCIRFSYISQPRIIPSSFQCLPSSEHKAPVLNFSSLRFGAPAYCQLHTSTAQAIRLGGDDEGEMGAFHHLYNAQREQNLTIRLREYLRVGLETGIFYAS